VYAKQGQIELTDEACFTFSKGTITAYDDTCPKDIVIPNTINEIPVTNIASSAFANKQLTSVIIPSGVTSIGNSAFSSNQLTSVVIPNSVTTIEERTFNTNQLKKVVISNQVTNIGKNAFANNQLTEVSLPDSVTTISASALNDNPLTHVVIPKNVTTIEQRALGSTIEYVINQTGKAFDWVYVTKGSINLDGSPIAYFVTRVNNEYNITVTDK